MNSDSSVCTCILRPFIGPVDYNLTLCPLQSRLQLIYRGQPFARVDLFLCLSRIYSPVRDFEFGLSKLQQFFFYVTIHKHKTIYQLYFFVYTKATTIFFLIWCRMEQTCFSLPSSTPPKWRSLAPFKSWVSCPEQDRVRFPWGRNSEVANILKVSGLQGQQVFGKRFIKSCSGLTIKTPWPKDYFLIATYLRGIVRV
jgi:hypothetical protein